MPDQDRFRLFLLVLGVAAVHALCLAVILPSLITLPGPGAGLPQSTIVDVEVLPPEPQISLSAGTSQHVVETAVPAPLAGAAEASMTTPSDPSDITAALPEISQEADLAPEANPQPALEAPVASDPNANTNTLANVSPAPPQAASPEKIASPPENAAAISDAPQMAALPAEGELPAAAVGVPLKKPAKLEKPAVKPHAAAKAVKPRAKPQTAAVAKAQTQNTGSLNAFFQGLNQPGSKSKSQQATSSR